VRRISRDWLLSPEMDLRSIERMLDEEFLAPVACFHAQQCVEKSLKAILEEKGVRPPKTHDVLRLYGLVSETVGLELDLGTLQVLNDLYVDASYPGNWACCPTAGPHRTMPGSFTSSPLRYTGGPGSWLLGNRQKGGAGNRPE
jgi:HEPN domain-containing protein